MFNLLKPCQLAFVAMAGWINRQQQQVIEFQQEEIRTLRELLGNKRMLFTDEQRRRLAAKAKVLGPQILKQLEHCLVTPDTLMRWYRKLIAEKYDGSKKRRLGRRRKAEDVRELILRMARENLGWGYTRIEGALKNLGHAVGRSTIRRIMLENGLDPAPKRQKGMSWAEFLRIHWEQIAAADFFTVEVMTLRGLVRYSVLFVVELSTRKVKIAGIVPEPNGEWMKQVARSLTDAVDGFLLGKRYFIHDRDSVFTEAFRGMLRAAGVDPIKLPPESPNLNAYAERFVRSIKSECLERMLFFSEGALRRAVAEYVAHYHGERNHQGLGNRLIEATEGIVASSSQVECYERLGGLLRFYCPRAA